MNRVQKGLSRTLSPVRTRAGFTKSESGVIYLHARRDCFRDYPPNSPPSRPVSCVGRGVVSQGNATADAVCGPEPVSLTKPQTTIEEPRGEIQLTTACPTTTVTDLVPESTVDVTPLPRLTKSRDGEGTANYSVLPIGSIMKNLLSFNLFFFLNNNTDNNMYFFLYTFALCLCQCLCLCCMSSEVLLHYSFC